MDQSQLDLLTEVLSGNDNEEKVKILHGLEVYLTETDQIIDSDQLTSTLASALKGNVNVSNAILGLLPFYFPLLVPQLNSDLPTSSTNTTASRALRNAFNLLLPTDKLADSKEKTRTLARNAFISAAVTAVRLGAKTTAPADKDSPWSYLQRVVEENGFRSKNAKVREQMLHYLLAIRQPSTDHPEVPLKPFTPLLLTLLADSDQTVRALALSVTIQVFSAKSVSPPAKADLKDQLLKKDLTKKTQDSILAAVLGERTSTNGGSINGDVTTAVNEPEITPTTTTSGSSKPLVRGSTTIPTILPASAFSTEPLPGSADVQAIYIASEADLVKEFETMKEGFVGKETEHNWMVRDKSIAKIRGMIEGGVTRGAFVEAFLIEFKSSLDGVLRTASSLRTTLATSALSLISELSISLGPVLDFLLEPLLSHCLSMAGQTKKIVATASQSAVTNLISNSAYHLKTLQLLWIGMNDKIVLARTFVSAHIVTFIKIHGERSKSIIESSGGLEILSQCISKGLIDPNSIVKENTRIAFWLSSEIWLNMTDKILAGLDSSTRKALEKADPSSTVTIAPTAVKAVRLTMREQMLAKKAALERIEPVASGSKSPPPISPRSPPPSLSRSPPPGQNRLLQPRISSSPVPLTSPSRLPTLSPTRVPKFIPPISVRSPPRQVNSLPKIQRPTTQEDSNLMKLTSPFRLGDRDDSSLDFSQSTEAEEAGINSIRKLSIEPVEAALRSQADQAIQAAERLVEIADEDGILVERIDKNSERNGKLEGGKKLALGNIFRTPLGKKGPLAGLRNDSEVFSDSPDKSRGVSGFGKRNWWSIKSSHLPVVVLPPDSAEKTIEINQLVLSLQNGSIDERGIERLSLICQARPVREEEEVASKSNHDFWTKDNKAMKIFDGLKLALDRIEIRESGLLLLKDLLSNQFPLFSSDELEVFSLLLKLREESGRSTIAAVESIADMFLSQMEPLYGLSSIVHSLRDYLVNGSNPSCFGFGIRLLGKSFERLPAEVLEEELPKLSELIKKALVDQNSAELRRAAVTALVAANSSLQDEKKLYLLLGEIPEDVLNLLAYYLNKA